MVDGYFTGGKESLFDYWQDPERAKKFKSGGSRVSAVRYLLNKAEVEIHQGTWIDTAIGAGFVQSQLFQTVEPSLLVGVDFSRPMLELVDSEVERVLGSTFSLPFRKESSTIVTNIFCLSDYPDPSTAFEEYARVVKTGGLVMFLDYSSEDEYWTLRQQAHSEEVVGNINLRNPDTIKQFLPKMLRVVLNIILEAETSTDSFDSRIELPGTLKRAFLFVELYKPRGS
ncbi:MAG: class I SAM-dependent methyltransferase [Candidatus Kariarchaeaceae archaeon]